MVCNSFPTHNITCSLLTRHRLQEETAKVEEHLLTHPDFSGAIISAFTTSKADSFEQFLEPLQKLLRLSPPIASSLAHPDLFFRAAQKLRTKKALVRLNLLRIIRSVVESADEDGDLIESVGLGDVIRETAKTDPAILVREMASDLLRSSEINASRARSNGMVGEPTRRPLRRSSSSTMVPGCGTSLPPTPNSERPILGRVGSFFDPSFDLARPAAASHSRGLNSPIISTSSPYRPVSRDSNSGGHSASSSTSTVNWSVLNSPAANGFSSNLNNLGVNGLSPSLSNVIPKSRLPRTSISGRSGAPRMSFAATGGSGSAAIERPSSRPSSSRDRPSSSRSTTAEKMENLTPTHQVRPSSRLGQGQQQISHQRGGTNGNASGSNVRRARRLTSGEMR